LIDPEVSARGPVVDAQIRGAATRFFSNLRECVFASDLYSADTYVPEECLVLRSFLPANPDPHGVKASWTALALGVPERILRFFAAELGSLGGSALIPREGSHHSERTLSSSDQDMLQSEDSDEEDCSGDGIDCPPPEGDPAEAAQRTIEGPLRSVIRTYNCSFKDFEKAMKSDPYESLKSLTGIVQLVLTDPPYGTRKSRNRINSDHDNELSRAEITEAVSIIHSLLRKGGHCILFCPMSQFNDWHEEFGRHDDMLVDCMPLFLVKEPRAYSQMPYKKSTGLMNMVEIALHCCKGGAGKDALEMVAYKNFNAVSSRFVGWCNVIDNVPNLASGEAIRVEGANTRGRAGRLRCEQKCIPLIVELVSRFSLPADIVVDLFSGTYTTAAACLRQPRGHYRNFFGCELDTACHQASQSRLLVEYSAQVLQGTFGISEESPIWQAALILTRRSPGRSLQWRAPDGLPGCCTLPAHLLVFLSNMWGERDAFEELQDIPVDQWPPARLEYLERADPDVLRTVDALHHRVIVGNSTIPDAGQGLFTTCGRKSGDVIGWYNGSIVYRDISRPHGVYGSGITAVTSDRFKRYAISVDTTEVQIPGQRASSIFIIPSEFCAAAKVNDARYCSRKDQLCKARNDPPRKVNVKFDVRAPATSVYMLTNPYFITITACSDIEAGEELLVDYGNNYAHV
jgi:hypothetical protein